MNTGNLEKIENRELWKKCAAFHGHECGGLTIGYKAALYAIRLLDLAFSEDEQVVCIAENDACGIDAIQVILGCSAGKGNLFFHLRGKQAFSFYSRRTGKSVRLVLKPVRQAMSREESFAYYQGHSPEELFEVKETKIPASGESAHVCNPMCGDCCGELTGAKWIRLAGGKKLCLDCYHEYDRFHI